MIRPITDTLRQIGGGALIDEASDKLSDAVLAIDSRGGSAKVTITITIKKATRAGAVHVTGRVLSVLPKEDAYEALLWGTPDGNLVADDPSQMKLELKEVVNQMTGEIKVA